MFRVSSLSLVQHARCNSCNGPIVSYHDTDNLDVNMDSSSNGVYPQCVTSNSCHNGNNLHHGKHITSLVGNNSNMFNITHSKMMSISGLHAYTMTKSINNTGP